MIYSTETMKMAVVGDPIEHSLSPFMHGTLISDHHLNGVYLPFRVADEETSQFLDMAKYLKFSGFNATMPHKLHLLDLVDELDAEAEYCGAVNTVRIRDGVARGYNTDVRGLQMALEKHNVAVEGAKIMMIGAGGVAGALLRGLSRQGAESVTVLNRTKEKAEKICRDVRSADPAPLTPEMLCRYAETADLILNCTPLGMSGVQGNFDDLSFLDHTEAFVCDLIYNPWETRLLAEARKRSLSCMNGLDMLIYQGLLSFMIFTDTSLDLHKEHERLYALCLDRLHLEVNEEERK